MHLVLNCVWYQAEIEALTCRSNALNYIMLLTSPIEGRGEVKTCRTTFRCTVLIRVFDTSRCNLIAINPHCYTSLQTNII